jgi:endonuclease YncB( thermonuclease family)
MTRGGTVTAPHAKFCAQMLLFCLIVAAVTDSARASGCAFEAQGEGRVASVTDARSFRLDDGREVRLAGIEIGDRQKAIAALSELILGRDISLQGEDDAPDRYGRQAAFAFVSGSDTPLQSELLKQGLAMVSPEVSNRDCAVLLLAAEAEARLAKRGTWAEASAIKNAESPGDILAGIGRFAVVEGKVLSVRQSGATTYLNFGRNWTRDFAVTISRRMIPTLEAAGLTPKSLENRRIRVRGWVEARNGPRIELLRVGQLEVLGGN